MSSADNVGSSSGEGGALPGWLVNGCYTVASLVGLVLVLLYKFQDKMLYFPEIPGVPYKRPGENPEGYRSPMEAAQLSFENVMLKTRDGAEIHTWLMLQQNNPETSPTLIYFHGNAGNMGLRLPNAVNMYHRCGLNVLMMDYRGYGDSKGVPNEAGLEADADAVLAHALAHPKLSNSPLVLFGRSLGGAVAVSLAARNPDKIAGIVVENTFLSISAMVDVLLPWVAFAKNLVLRIGWDSSERVKELKCPMMFISGDADELVPPPQMKALHDLATKAIFRDFYSISGGGHNDSFMKAGVHYYRRLRDFVQSEHVAKVVTGSCGEKGDDDEAPALVKSSVQLPTMQTNFQVK